MVQRIIRIFRVGDWRIGCLPSLLVLGVDGGFR